MQLPEFSEHAKRRMAQRGLKETQVIEVIRKGAKHRSSERKATLFFGDKRCPENLQGIHVLVSSDGCQIITCYKNKKLNWHDN